MITEVKERRVNVKDNRHRFSAIVIDGEVTEIEED